MRATPSPFAVPRFTHALAFRCRDSCGVLRSAFCSAFRFCGAGSPCQGWSSRSGGWSLVDGGWWLAVDIRVFVSTLLLPFAHVRVLNVEYSYSPCPKPAVRSLSPLVSPSLCASVHFLACAASSRSHCLSLSFSSFASLVCVPFPPCSPYAQVLLVLGESVCSQTR